MIISARKILIKALYLAIPGVCFLVPNQAHADATVTTDWGQVKRKVDSLSFGINLARGHIPDITGNPAYVKGVSYAVKKSGSSSSLVRLNDNGLTKFWSNGGSWNADKIKAALAPLVAAGLTLQIDIDAGLNSPIVTPADAAELVRIINIQSKFNVKHWEVPNEKWGFTGTAFKEIARAMKAVDPTIQVGGPGFFWLALDSLTRFTRDAMPDIDFVSFHNYAVEGDTARSDQDVYDRIKTLGDQVQQLRKNLDQISPNRRIPIQWNEYNITWHWQGTNPRDPRVRTNKGAVVDALFMITTVESGADISNVWNECEDTFGFMSCSGDLYIPAHVFHLFNQYMHGSQVAATSSNSGSVVAFAVKSDTAFSIALINRSASSQKTSLQNSGGTLPQQWSRHQIWEDGYTTQVSLRTQDMNGGIVLPANSVTILTTMHISGSTALAGKTARAEMKPASGAWYDAKGKTLRPLKKGVGGDASEAMAPQSLLFPKP